MQLADIFGSDPKFSGFKSLIRHHYLCRISLMVKRDSATVKLRVRFSLLAPQHSRKDVGFQTRLIISVTLGSIPAPATKNNNAR